MQKLRLLCDLAGLHFSPVQTTYPCGSSEFPIDLERVNTWVVSDLSTLVSASKLKLTVS